MRRKENVKCLLGSSAHPLCQHCPVSTPRPMVMVWVSISVQQYTSSYLWVGSTDTTEMALGTRPIFLPLCLDRRKSASSKHPPFRVITHPGEYPPLDGENSTLILGSSAAMPARAAPRAMIFR